MSRMLSLHYDAVVQNKPITYKLWTVIRHLNSFTLPSTEIGFKSKLELLKPTNCVFMEKCSRYFHFTSFHSFGCIFLLLFKLTNDSFFWHRDSFEIVFVVCWKKQFWIIVKLLVINMSMFLTSYHTYRASVCTFP